MAERTNDGGRRGLVSAIGSAAGPSCLGVRRHPVYSPGRIEADARVLLGVAEALRQRGYAVEVRDETELDRPTAAVIVFGMAQSPEGIRWLGVLQRQGRVVVNTPESIRNCHRMRMIPLLQSAGVPVPASVCVDLEREVRLPNGSSGRRWWVKRGDVHATEPGDVVAVDDPAGLPAVLEGFRRRGIGRVVIQDHVEGTVVKFYAVRGTSFFFWQVRDPADRRRVDAAVLRHWAVRAAEALGLDVYGGDAIVKPDGTVVVIDVNDWPSFAPCVDAAIPFIVEGILRRARAAGVGGLPGGRG